MLGVNKGECLVALTWFGYYIEGSTMYPGNVGLTKILQILTSDSGVQQSSHLDLYAIDQNEVK